MRSVLTLTRGLLSGAAFVLALTGASTLTHSAMAAGKLPAPRHTVDPYSTRPALPHGAISSEGPHDPVFLQPIVPAATAHWTFLVYIVGDNNLEDYVTTDIETELGLQGSNADVQVVALADRSPEYSVADGNWTDTRLFHVVAGQRATAEAAISTWGERNMGDPETLIEFMDFAHTYYPAEHYALVFWDHGWVWRPGQANLDETDADTLDQDEIGYALSQSGPVDVIGYDACLMSTLENYAQVRPYAKAIASSEDYVGYDGFEYDQVIASLRKNPTMGAEELAVALAESMTDRTITAATLGPEYDALQTAVDNWAKLLKAGMPKYTKSIEQAWKATKGFADPLTKDLRDAAEKVKANVADSQIKAASQAVIDAFDQVVLYEWHLDAYTRAYGITIFWPQGPKDLDAPSSPVNDFDYYRTRLDFARKTSWDEFVYAYANR